MGILIKIADKMPNVFAKPMVIQIILKDPLSGFCLPVSFERQNLFRRTSEMNQIDQIRIKTDINILIY
jgi:hypothetical protein